MSDLTPETVPLHPPPTHAHGPIHVDEGGYLVEDPCAVLGLAPGTHDPDTVRAAYRDALLARPPESDPDGARAARLARDRLLNPKHLLTRELGTLTVPDPDAWDLPDLRGPAVTEPLNPTSRLLGQAVLYVLVEQALWDEGLGDEVMAAARAAEAQREG